MGSGVMRPGPPALCRGTVFHHRRGSKEHAFSYDVVYAWFDPDDPESLTDRHWAWSTGRFRPARLARADYGWPDGASAARVAELMSTVVPGIEVGPVRLLTQPRRWGWLFNPISIYLVWPADSDQGPVGAVLEVTNTPWKERHHYPVALEQRGPSGETTSTFGATFAKDLHVSPFLPMDMTYHLELCERSPSAERDREGLLVSISVTDPAGDTVLETGMNLDRQPATTRTLSETLRRDGLPTHRISGGIHHQAARLAAKGVPFVPHPKRSPRGGPA